MIENPMTTIGRPDELEAALGLNALVAPHIGAIVIFAGNVEYRLEKAIWRLQNHAPEGVRHATDAKPIGELIDMFEVEGSALPAGPERELIELWCAAARVAFDFRHSIAHGVAFRLETIMNIERNRSWQGEIRKRPAASLWGDQNTFENIRLTFAVLLRVIASVSSDKRTLQEVATPDRLKALRWAKSLMGEMASGHGPWFEKY